MIENILMNVIQIMGDTLDAEQLDKLQNVLYIQFHDKQVVQDTYELAATGTNNDTYKI